MKTILKPDGTEGKVLEMDECVIYYESWQEWWQKGIELMKQVHKLLPDYVTMYYLFEAKPIFLKDYQGNYYWNRNGEKALVE